MPFFQPAFYVPTQVDSNAFGNIFQLLNDFDNYQRETASESAKPKQQQQQQRPAQPKIKPQEKPQVSQQQQQQQKPQALQQKPQSQAPQQSQKKQSAVFRNPFEEFFNSLQESAAAAQRATSLSTFNPRFDVRETKDSYELHGELAGIDRNNISLEFTEPQTLVVSGKVERNYHSKNNNNNNEAAVPAVENTPEAIADTHSEAGHDDDNASASGARTPIEEEYTEVHSQRSASPARSHRATVTDEEDEAALERGKAVEDEKKTVATTPAPVAPAPAQTTAAPSERYWYQERTVGSFRREFNFPVPVDENNVRASLDNGILSVSVPKIKREARRIAVL